MKIKKLLAVLMAATMAVSLAACKDSEDEPTDTNTVTGGSAEDVFGLGDSATNGEDVTIDPALVDGDTGEIDEAKATSTRKSTTTTTKPNIKNETTISGNLLATSTESGYRISWSAVSGAQKYNVYRATSKDGEYTYIGSTTDTYYIDKDGGSNYSYKITVASNSTGTSTPTNSANFKGSTSQFSNADGKQTFISSNLNNTYVAFVRSEYAKKGITCPPGRLAYVQITGIDYLYVFQFSSTKTWDGTTLEQVHIFTDKNDRSKYFSFFTKDTGSADYLAAKKTAEAKWAESQKKAGSDTTSYADMQALLVTLAEDTHFQTVIDASYS